MNTVLKGGKVKELKLVIISTINEEFQKARILGAKDIRKRKRRLREKKTLNPDYVALGPIEFKKLKKQDPGYKHSKYI